MGHKTCGNCRHWSSEGNLGFCAYDYHDLRLPFWMVDMARDKWAPITGPEVGIDCQLWEPVDAKA